MNNDIIKASEYKDQRRREREVKWHEKVMHGQFFRDTDWIADKEKSRRLKESDFHKCYKAERLSYPHGINLDYQKLFFHYKKQKYFQYYLCLFSPAGLQAMISNMSIYK